MQSKKQSDDLMTFYGQIIRISVVFNHLATGSYPGYFTVRHQTTHLTASCFTGNVQKTYCNPAHAHIFHTAKEPIFIAET